MLAMTFGTVRDQRGAPAQLAAVGPARRTERRLRRQQRHVTPA